MSLFDEAAGKTEVVVETTIGTWRFNVGEQLESEQGVVSAALQKALRPKVSVLVGGSLVIPPIAPAGDPAQGPKLGLYLGIALVAVALLLSFR